MEQTIKSAAEAARRRGSIPFTLPDGPPGVMTFSPRQPTLAPPECGTYLGAPASQRGKDNRES